MGEAHCCEQCQCNYCTQTHYSRPVQHASSSCSNPEFCETCAQAFRGQEETCCAQCQCSYCSQGGHSNSGAADSGGYRPPTPKRPTPPEERYPCIRGDKGCSVKGKCYYAIGAFGQSKKK